MTTNEAPIAYDDDLSHCFRNMTLASKTWMRVSVHGVVVEWCRAERDTRVVHAIEPADMPLIDRLWLRPCAARVDRAAPTA
jgi:hypothetical protein